MTPPGELPVPVPAVNPETQPFWDAAAKGTFLLKRCRDCEAVIWYPRQLCVECSSLDTEWFAASGRGEIYSYTINYRGEGAYRDAAPYVIAYVELEEGPRVLTSIVETPHEDLAVGLGVEVVFEASPEGTVLYRFRSRVR